MKLNDNQLSGRIPEELCNITTSLSLENNKLCSPYPECLLESDIGYQDISDCHNLFPYTPTKIVHPSSAQHAHIHPDDLVVPAHPFPYLPGDHGGYPMIKPYPFICPSEAGSGDVNGDGSSDVIDIVLIVNVILGGSFADHCAGAAADLNGDGSADVLDIVHIVNLVLGE